MFGSSKYQSQTDDPAVVLATNPAHATVAVSENQIAAVTDSTDTQMVPEPHALSSTPTAPTLDESATVNQPAPAPAVDTPADVHPTIDINSTTLEESSDKVSPDVAQSVDTPPLPAATLATAPAAPVPAPAANEDNLLDIKKDALQSLAPLVSQLEQTPEEKFKTTMMLIQASDNSNLVKEAYEAANAIPDEKVRAQALLDIVNEINYFTQSSKDAG